MREIIDVPRIFMRAAVCDWRPDWRGQATQGDIGGGDQTVYNRFPRFVGSPPLVLPEPMIGAWRALILRGQGRVNAYRIRMIDPIGHHIASAGWWSDWQAWRSGQYVEPRPQVFCVGAVLAGASSITVDESGAREPVRIGAYLSHNDWPFAVTGRSGSGAATVLQVTMLRRPIADGAAIDLFARGIFTAADDAMGWPDYDTSRVARPVLALQEWITRT